jgi:hypothetical protein
MRNIPLLIALSIILATGCLPVGPGQAVEAPTAQAGELVVDPKMELGPISPYIYGSNYGPWTAVPAGKMEEALNSHVSALRWPGGNWGDQNDITTNQLDWFIKLCKQMGAVPTISVRLLDGTPETAAGLLRYANLEKGYQIRYWSVGNEPDLFDRKPNVDYDTARFNREWRAMAVAMKAVDPSILLMGPELSGGYTSNFESNPKDAAGRDWMTEFLKANGDLVDIVTYHRYPFPLPNDTKNVTIDQLRQDPPEWTRTVRALRTLVRETTGRDLPIAVTEANANSGPVVRGEASPDSFYAAIWWADVLGRMIDEDVLMVNQFMLSTASGQAGGWGLISILGLAPAYYVYQMYNHFGTERVYASSGVANVSIYAAKREDGTLTLMVINLADGEQRVALQIQGKSPRKAEVWLFDADHNAEDLGEQKFPEDGILTLPPQSISLYGIPR